MIQRLGKEWEVGAEDRRKEQVTKFLSEKPFIYSSEQQCLQISHCWIWSSFQKVFLPFLYKTPLSPSSLLPFKSLLGFFLFIFYLGLATGLPQSLIWFFYLIFWVSSFLESSVSAIIQVFFDPYLQFCFSCSTCWLGPFI
jgi:hypothetical protein